MIVNVPLLLAASVLYAIVPVGMAVASLIRAKSPSSLTS